MAEENKPVETGDGKPEGDTAKLSQELEQLKTRLAASEGEREKLESIRKELEETRQAAKERERKALEEQGQYKTVAEMQAEELKKTKEQLEAMAKEKTELEGLKVEAEAWKSYQEERRKSLLEQLPEERREKFSSASLDLLEETVALIGGKPVGTFTGGSKQQVTGKGSKWSEMDDATRAQKARELDTDELTKLIASG